MTDQHTPLGRAILRELRAIQDTYLKAIKLNAKSAAQKHLELMEKFEGDYDNTDLDHSNKPQFAGTLARMSDASLRATGQFNQQKQSGGVKVEINIDLGGKEDPPPVDVEHEVIEE